MKLIVIITFDSLKVASKIGSNCLEDVGITLKREYVENKAYNCGEYLYGYFESFIIANLYISSCIFSALTY